MGITVSGIEATIENLDEVPDELRKQFANRLNATAEGIRSEAIKQLTKQSAIGVSGLLRASVQVRNRAKATDLRAVVKAGGSAKKGTVDYATFVEFGTKPHFPPVEAVTGEVEALDRWVELKVDPEDTESTAFAIAKTISRVGTDPQPYMRPAARKGQTILKRELSKIDL
jgi:HK97 gp10 family phage protein